MYGCDRRAKLVACWHEAGHAVAAVVCGGSVSGIEVNDAGGGTTWVVHPPGLIERLTIVYGGEVTRAYGLFIGSNGGTDGDAARLRDLTAHLTPDKRAAALAEAERRAIEIVCQNLTPISHLAEALRCVGTLNEQQVDEILAQHGL